MEWTKDKVLLYSTGNYIQYPVINDNGKEDEKECVYVYVCVCVYIYIYTHIYNWITYCIVEINITLSINYTSIKYIKNKKKKSLEEANHAGPCGQQ